MNLELLGGLVGNQARQAFPYHVVFFFQLQFKIQTSQEIKPSKKLCFYGAVIPPPPGNLAAKTLVSQVGVVP